MRKRVCEAGGRPRSSRGYRSVGRLQVIEYEQHRSEGGGKRALSGCPAREPLVARGWGAWPGRAYRKAVWWRWGRGGGAGSAQGGVRAMVGANLWHNAIGACCGTPWGKACPVASTSNTLYHPEQHKSTPHGERRSDHCIIIYFKLEGGL